MGFWRPAGCLSDGTPFSVAGGGETRSLSAVRSAAGEGCGEGFPLPAKNDGGNRGAIPAITRWEERPARAEPVRFGWGVVVETVRGALSTGC